MHDPGLGQVTGATHEIEYGVLLLGVVIGRSVHDQVPQTVGHVRVVIVRGP